MTAIAPIMIITIFVLIFGHATSSPVPTFQGAHEVFDGSNFKPPSSGATNPGFDSGFDGSNLRPGTSPGFDAGFDGSNLRPGGSSNSGYDSGFDGSNLKPGFDSGFDGTQLHRH